MLIVLELKNAARHYFQAGWMAGCQPSKRVQEARSNARRPDEGIQGGDVLNGPVPTLTGVVNTEYRRFLHMCIYMFFYKHLCISVFLSFFLSFVLSLSLYIYIPR